MIAAEKPSAATETGTERRSPGQPEKMAKTPTWFNPVGVFGVWGAVERKKQLGFCH